MTNKRQRRRACRQKETPVLTGWARRDPRSVTLLPTGLADGFGPVPPYPRGAGLSAAGPVELTPFKWGPRSSGTGEFVRLVDGRAFDSWRFTISEIPDPELVRVRDYGDSVIVQSVSWGEFNGRVNRSIVAIKEGQNVEEPRLVDEEVDRQTYQITRTWSIRRLDAGRKSGFVLRAWDQRGLSHSTDLSIAGTSPR